MMSLRSAFVALSVLAVLCGSATAQAWREQVEADWLRQARPGAAGAPGLGVPTWADAAGAVDGVKNGKYAFHTAAEAAPWWQVDLAAPVAISRIVIYNRLDYAPGLHNADGLLLFTSDDGKAWTLRHDNRGKHFGGVGGAGPLEVRFAPGRVRGRHVRLQIRRKGGVFFHLDEVEVYGPGQPEPNLALKCPADQSSVSQWSTVKPHARPPGGPAPDYPTGRVLARARLLAAELRSMGVDTRPHERALDQAEARHKSLPAAAPAAARREAYLQARRAVRGLAFANPLLAFDKLFLVQRHTQETYPDVCLNHMPWVSRPGGDLCILHGPFSDAPRVSRVLDGALGPGHVHGADLWWDASRIVFGYAKARTAQPPRGWRDRRTNFDLRRTEEPTHLFEVDVDSKTGLRLPGRAVRQITRGSWSDLDPTYLPGGQIAFASERCGYSLQCNEYDKDETSCNLYAVKPDGSGVRRLSASKDGDYLPHALADGTIGYTRWEYQERSWAHIQSIWTVRPDGTGADALFKQHMNDPWALEDMRSIPGGAKLVAIATGHHTLAAGPVVVIDPGRGFNTAEGIRIVTPGVAPPEGGMAGRDVPEGGVADKGGFYMTPWPLSEKFFLVSYCYGGQTDPAGYGLYLIDVFGTKELIYRDAAISCTIPIPYRPRKRPPILTDVTDESRPWAICAVTDAARGADGIAPKAVRYIRISQRLPWPYDHTRGGQRYEPDAKGGRNWTPARVIGTVPVEPDGSACFRVPADQAVYFQLLDKDHMELRRMRSFISLQAGEVRGCGGCHETRAVAPRAATGTMALRREPSEPTPPPWGREPISFLRDVQPVLDKHCATCHTGLRPGGGLDMSAGLTARHNRAFDSLVDPRRALVSCCNVHEDARITQPLAFGSHRSKLLAVLRKKPHTERVKLTAEDWLRLVTWIDLNAPYHDRFLNKRPKRPPYDLAADAGLARAISTVHARRCAACHKPADVSRLDWIDLRRPAESLFLRAPLAPAAGGAALCNRPGPDTAAATITYQDPADPDYAALLRQIEQAVRQLWDRPRRDLESLPPPTP